MTINGYVESTRLTSGIPIWAPQDVGVRVPVEGIDWTIRKVHSAYSVKLVRRRWWHRKRLCRLIWRWF